MTVVVGCIQCVLDVLNSSRCICNGCMQCVIGVLMYVVHSGCTDVYSV